MAKNNAASVDPNVMNFEESLGSVVENRLKFKPRAALSDLCQGYLETCTVECHTANTIDPKTKLPSSWEYAGLDIPNLVLTFKEKPVDGDPADRYYTFSVSPFTNMTKTGVVSDASIIRSHYENEYKLLRHIANAFVSNPNYNKDVKIPGFNPFNEDPIARLADMKVYYEAWATLFNGKDGKGFSAQLCNMKLVTSQSGTYLTFPGFVGEGFIQKAVQGIKPTIELKANESVALRAATKDGKGAKGAKGADDDSSSEDAIPADLAALIKGYNK